LHWWKNRRTTHDCDVMFHPIVEVPQGNTGERRAERSLPVFQEGTMVMRVTPDGHPPCPVCDMGMIVVDGYRLDFKNQTFECLRCGHVEYPDSKTRKQAAE
jgi:hypothetical protein